MVRLSSSRSSPTSQLTFDHPVCCPSSPSPPTAFKASKFNRPASRLPRPLPFSHVEPLPILQLYVRFTLLPPPALKLTVPPSPAHLAPANRQLSLQDTVRRSLVGRWSVLLYSGSPREKLTLSGLCRTFASRFDVFFGREPYVLRNFSLVNSVSNLKTPAELRTHARALVLASFDGTTLAPHRRWVTTAFVADAVTATDLDDYSLDVRLGTLVFRPETWRKRAERCLEKVELRAKVLEAVERLYEVGFPPSPLCRLPRLMSFLSQRARLDDSKPAVQWRTLAIPLDLPSLHVRCFSLPLLSPVGAHNLSSLCRSSASSASSPPSPALRLDRRYPRR